MSEKLIKLAACGCRSWFCDHCCKGKGGELRQRVQWVVDRCFKDLLFLTLTINPKRFDSPWEAYLAGSARISRVVAKLHARGFLHSRQSFRVLESHKNGWPHFHVLVDAKFVPFDALWRAWNGAERTEASKRNPEWGIVDVRGGDKFESREHAVNYITAYVTKRPESGWPEWILDSTRRIRRFACSKGFWGELNAAKPEAVAFEATELEREPVKRRRLATGYTHRRRCGTCANKTVAHVITEEVKPDGEIREHRKFLGIFGDAIGECCEQLSVELVEGARSVRLAFDEFVVEFIKANCIVEALRKHRLDEKIRAAVARACARGRPVVQQFLLDVSPDLTWSGVGV